MHEPNNTDAGSVPTEAAVPTRELSIRDFLDILLKGKWSIISSFSIVFLAVAVYTFMQDPIYSASSVILIENTKGTQQQRLEDILTGSVNRNVYNEVEILSSRTLANRVARRLLDTNDPALSVLETTEGGLPDERTVTDRILGMRDVRPMGKEVDMIRVEVESTKPEEAAQIANVYAEQYIIKNRLDSRRQMTESKDFLEEQLEVFRGDLGTIETRLEGFQEEAGVTIDSEAEQLLTQMGTILTERDRTVVDLGVARQELRALVAQADEVEPGLARSITSGVDQKIKLAQQRILQLETEIDQFLAKNPQFRGKEESMPELAEKLREKEVYQMQIRELTSQYLQEVDELGGVDPTVGGQGNPMAYVMELRKQIAQKRIQVSGLEEKNSILDDRLGSYRAQLNRIPGKVIQQAQLEREREAKDEIYRTVAKRLQETRIAEQSEVGYASIVDNAIVPYGPVRPKKALNLLLGSVFGLILGLCVVFLRNAMDNKIRKPEDLRARGISVVGNVPDMARVVRSDFGGKERIESDGRSYSTSLIALLNPLSPVSETYRRLRTNIQFSRPDVDIQTIMLTSSGPGEGKTVTTTNLAITMAQAGRRTLYIDADLRRPTGHKLLGSPREPGLVELLFDKHPPDMRYFATGIDDLFVIPAGSSVPNPAELMGSNKMKELLKRMRDEFDYIIIDTPPILAVTDAVLLSTLSDAVAIVVSANETDGHALDRALETLKAVGAPFVGCVLNKFDVKRAYGYYGYRYSYGYGYGYGYDYYGESKGEDRKKGLLEKMRG